ncbi:MAG: hypothetical protein MR958_04335, partial [Spirochaetia bacterium]|nr:hypothetical protein [Spirochaetia bacterium]
ILNLKKDFTDNGKWESEETLVINGTETQSFTPQSTGSTYNKILIQKTAAATDDKVIFTDANTLKATTVTIENNDTTNFNGPVSIGTLNDVAASSEAPGSITINGGGTISTATLNTTGDLTVTSDAGLTITNLTHTTGETKVNGKLTLTEDSTVGKITIAKTDGKLQGASGKTITVLGHWTNNGTFTANAGIVTFDGTLTIAGRSEFNTANMAGTISITSANQYATLNIYNSSSTNNSDPANPVTEITPSRITFPAGPTNVQTVTTALFLKGNSAEKLLQLKSSSSTQITDTTEADCFYINFTGTITDTDESKNPDIQFVKMTNGYNASGDGTTHNYITTYNSIDNGNNYYWNFNGCTYTWTGKHSTAYTDWFNRANWDRNSVPGINVNIKINKEYTIGGITTAVENNHWPLLAADATRNISGNLELGETGTLTIGPDAQLDIATYNINAAANTASITNNGLIRIRGVTGQTIAGTMNNGSGSTIEYYDAPASQIVSLPWDGEGTTATAGKQYANLLVSGILTVPAADIICSENAEFTNDADINSISVTGTTDFTKGSAQKLTGSSTFNGKVTSVSNLELNGTVTIATTLPADAAEGSVPTLSITAPLITFDSTVDSSDKTQVLEITGNAIFHDKVGATNELASLSVSGTTTIDTSKIKTTGTQTYTGAVTIDTTLPAGAAAGSVPTATLTASTVTFSSTVDGNDEDKALTVSGNAVFNADVAATKKLASLGIAGTTELTSSISFNCNTTFGNSILGTTHTVTLNNDSYTINDSADDDTSVTVEPIVINNATLTAGNNVVFQNKVQNDGTLNCNNGNVIFQKVYLPTMANTFNAGTGTVTFNKDVTFTNTTFAHNNGTIILDPSAASLTVSGSGSQEYNKVQIKGSVTFDSTNTFNTLNAESLGGKTITFPANKTQTVKIKLSLTGTKEDGSSINYLVLKSDAANSDTESDCFKLLFEPAVTNDNFLMQYIDMQNGYNAKTTPAPESAPVYISLKNSEDSGNNYYWNFPGLTYIWTGATDTDWFVRTNWNRKSVPGKDSNISINEKVNGASVTNWPDLDNSTYPTGVSQVDMGQGEITIGQKAELHINRKNLAARTITNSGLVKIKGTDAAQTITGTRVNSTGSTVEYYSGTTATPTINFAWGNKYANLLITDVTNNSSDLEISEKLIIKNNTDLSGKLAVTGTTTIETTENVSLTGSNNLAGGVVINKVNDAVLNNNGTFNLTQTAGADINTLTINSPVTLKTNVITTSSQTYNDEITLTKASELTVSNSTPADLLTINNKLSGSTYALAIDANTSFTSEEKVTAGYIKSAGTKDRTWTSTTKANLDSDLYIDCDTNKIIFDGNFTANNIYMYNGAVTVKSGKTLEALHNLAVWGAAYSATDKRYSANNTRFEYYTAPAFSFAYTQDSRTTTFDSLAGSTIKVCNNFYLNGTDLPSVTLDLPANTSSKPELNTTAAVTEKQWGLPYAAIFNSAITGVTANTGYVTAAIEQGNTDKGGNNQNLQFEIPQIAQAYTVYDDVIYVEFTLPVENAHNEINTNLGAGATAESNGELSKGGLWYNNKEYRFHPVAYTDKDCTTELEASSEGVTSFYLKTIHTETNTAASYWNTDADGEYAYNQIATNPLESTDRNGIHHNITVDLSMLEGMFTSAKGHTMSSNYGINFEADGSIEAEGFTATQDKCSPVLLAVYTGQENHIPDSDIQPDYDAHNFVEFLYSEPVDIGNETTALKAEDGENNIQASATLGGITGAGVGTGITPATGKGLTIAGLAAFTDGRLNSGNKLDSSSPHSLYRNFSTSVSQSAEKQTNRIRVSIAGYVDGTIDGTHKNWIGYIDYSEMPANGSTVRAIENDYLTDTNGNSIDVKGTQTNHKIATEFKLNQGAKNETLNAIYGSWDTSAPVFSQIRKIRNDYADEYEIVPTGNGSVIDKLEFHILDNEDNGDNTYFVFTHGWSQMLDAPDSEGYRYSLKPGFQAADKFGGSRAFANGAARTGGGIRYSSYYNMQSAFKFGIHSDAEPVYNFTAIKPGATSSYFTGSSNDAYPIPSTDDNNYISLEISGSSYSYEVQFSISYDNTNAYITDLAGNRLQNALMSSIDRTPPDFDITLAPVGGNTHGNGELYIVFVKKLKLENISVGSYTHEKLVDVLPSIVQFGTINSSFTEDTSLKVESAQVYEPLTVTGTHKGDKEFTAFKLTLNRAVTLDDIKTKYIRIAFPASESEYSLDPFTLAAGARVTYIQDFDGISYLQMYKAHPLSDFAINVINPEYAYDPDYTGDNAASMMRSPDDENGSWAVHDWSKDQKNFGTLPYGGQINLITNTTSDGDSDDSNDAGVPATQSFTLYLSKAPTAESVSTHFNNDFDTKKRIWLPQVTGTPAFEPLSDVLNENFETVLHTAAPDFDEEKYPNRIQFNFNQKDYDWNSGDQIQFLFGLNGTSIMHNPDNTNDGSSYTGISSPIYALRTSNILNPDIQTLDLWSFKLKAVTTQRGGVSIYNNVINVLKGERTTIKVSMPRKGNLKVIVMTLDGNVISYLENSNNVSGDHIYTWNGTNKKGNMVARGLYFIRVIGEGIDETRKVMCINEK